MSPYLRNALVLGLLSAVGPFAIDMYLPALPAIATDLHASTFGTQLTLAAFFIAFGLCQLVYGPVSDMAGRKPPLYVGLVLFLLGSVGCAVAPGIEALIAARVVQGVGAASVMVIPRAIIRDLHTGIAATKLMSLIMLVISVSPILAPLFGSALIVPFGWRAVFVAISVIALVSLALLAFVQTETHPPEKRMPLRVGAIASGFVTLLRDPRFLTLTFVGGFGMASFFAFIATASFVYIGHYGLTPTQFSLSFGFNAIGFIGASQFAATLGSRFGAERVITMALVSYAFFALLLLALTLAGVDRFVVLAALLFLAFANLGLVIPTTMVLALDDHGPIAGLASALGGTLQMVTGAAMIGVAGIFFDGTPKPMVIAISLCAISALVLALVTPAPKHAAEF